MRGNTKKPAILHTICHGRTPPQKGQHSTHYTSLELPLLALTHFPPLWDILYVT